MNRDQLEGKWKQLQGDAKKRWGDLTDDEVQQVEGDYDKLVGLVQEKYGKSREEAERDVDAWQSEDV